MFTQSENQESRQFEAGFGRSREIIVKINKNINIETIELLNSVTEEWVNKFYSGTSSRNECIVNFIFDASGTDFRCVIMFDDCLKRLVSKYPKITFTGILEYAEGSVALMYMLMNKRMVIPNTREQGPNGITQVGKSALKFTVVPIVTNEEKKIKNNISKIFMDNITREQLKLCFPKNEQEVIQLCGDVIADDGFGTLLSME